MHHQAITAIEGIPGPHVALGESRLETLYLLVTGMVSARTVNLGHVACARPGTARIASTYRRLQRFFQPRFSNGTGRSRSWRGCSGRSGAGPSPSTGPTGRCAAET